MKHFGKLYHKLFLMEQNKYLPPKFSYAFKDLAEFFGVFAKFDKQSLSTNSSHHSFVSQTNIARAAKMHPQDSIHEIEEPVEPYAPRPKPKNPRNPSGSPASLSQKKIKGGRIQARKPTNKGGIVVMPGRPNKPLFMPQIAHPRNAADSDRNIESPVPPGKEAEKPIRYNKGGGNRRDSPNTTINNNNIIININKSYNVHEEEQQNGLSRMLESPLEGPDAQRDFEINEKQMNDALLREMENRVKRSPNSLDRGAPQRQVKAGNIAKLSLSPRNNRNISPLDRRPQKGMAGTTPVPRGGQHQHHLNPSPIQSSSLGYPSPGVGVGGFHHESPPSIARTQLDPIPPYQLQQQQRSARRQNKTGGSHLNQRSFGGTQIDFGLGGGGGGQEYYLPPDIRSESPVRRYNSTNYAAPRIKRKQAVHYAAVSGGVRQQGPVSFDGVRTDFEKNFSRMQIRKQDGRELAANSPSGSEQHVQQGTPHIRSPPVFRTIAESPPPPQPPRSLSRSRSKPSTAFPGTRSMQKMYSRRSFLAQSHQGLLETVEEKLDHAQLLRGDAPAPQPKISETRQNSDFSKRQTYLCESAEPIANMNLMDYMRSKIAKNAKLSRAQLSESALKHPQQGSGYSSARFSRRISSETTTPESRRKESGCGGERGAGGGGGAAKFPAAIAEEIARLKKARRLAEQRRGR